MGKRGPKPMGKIKIKWSSNFAYAIGLLVTDGCLYNDKRHMSLTTKDKEQADNFKQCLGLKVKSGLKSRGPSKKKEYYHIQFGDIIFYNFLVSIGLSQAKSKIIGAVTIPDKYFFDYLRGCFDGDGTFYSYWDPRWRSSHMFYIEFVSASKKHIVWLQKELNDRLRVIGHITSDGKKSTLQLKYAKKEAIVIIRNMYYNPRVKCLSRKKIKIQKALSVERQQQKKYARVL
ncbi:MAG: LAGLIDADG family homing endonuclease [Minisyncoccia bacterium]